MRPSTVRSGPAENEAQEGECGRADLRHVRPECDVVAEDAGQLKRHRSAAGQHQEPDPVVGVLVVSRSPDPIGQANRDHARAQHVVDLLPDAQIGREPDRGDDLGELHS